MLVLNDKNSVLFNVNLRVLQIFTTLLLPERQFSCRLRFRFLST